MTLLCTIYVRKFSPFPLAIALKNGDTSLPETSSGCVVMPSFTAWNPFSITTGAHPNHKVNMLPWIFASWRWERSQESTDEIPHTASRGWTCFCTDYRTSPKVEWCSPSFPQDYNYHQENRNVFSSIHCWKHLYIPTFQSHRPLSRNIVYLLLLYISQGSVHNDSWDKGYFLFINLFQEDFCHWYK